MNHLEPGMERPRRLRRTATIRQLVTETRLHPSQLVQPLFVMAGEGAPEPIASLPGQARLNVADLCDKVGRLLQLGIRGVALFPVLAQALKSPDGAEALNEETLVLRAIRAVKERYPEVVLFSDIALDPYTTHGHDGLLSEDGKEVENDRTVEVLCRMSVLHAGAGADFVAPSDMMDGRVGAIRRALDRADYSECGICAYSAKFNSAYYGPFREAVGSAAAAGTTGLSKASYQLDAANAKAALRELRLDTAEGADILMVKPAGPYLDILARATTDLPLAAYQVSGEYAQLHAAAAAGWLDLKRCRDESLLAIRRAGADIILTYFAEAWATDYASGAQ
jgi:porphobilinogen synthase